MTQTSVERKSQFGNSHPQPVAVLPQQQTQPPVQQKPAVPPVTWQQQPQVTVPTKPKTNIIQFTLN